MLVQGEKSLARHFQVPFASDSIAERVGNLFGGLCILKDESGELDNDICWIDILLSPRYERMLQEDGPYLLRLGGRYGLIKILKSDHDLIMTGIPQRLAHPRSYASDVLVEEESVLLVTEELPVLNEMASKQFPQGVYGRPMSQTAYLDGSVNANIYQRSRFWLSLKKSLGAVEASVPFRPLHIVPTTRLPEFSEKEANSFPEQCISNGQPSLNLLLIQAPPISRRGHGLLILRPQLIYLSLEEVAGVTPLVHKELYFYQ
ncbi:hypothetical protein CNMCM8980_005617 [Aspergillus fumigatiaffinis]|nr:hypothetical protein CNMCM8980_005617 [Aspergillus fumigatiaffinis]